MIRKIENVYTKEEIDEISAIIESSDFEEDERYGRIKSTLKFFPMHLRQKIINIIGDNNLILANVSAVEYNLKYGIPNLPPHFDGDTIELIFNYQFLSNTSWSLGLNTEIYSLEDNSALVFNPNQQVHWRPVKLFKEEEYLKMIFFRFSFKENLSNYSNLRFWPGDDVFLEINKFRDSLNNEF